MTSKKRRQRGSRTHGGGTHKNRRGAGNRGGRGRAGRKKHRFHGFEPVGKHGFTRPPETQPSVAEVDLQQIDEDVGLLAADGLAEETDDGYRIDAREVAEESDRADVVKVLGSAQVRHSLTIIADDFTEMAIDRLEAAGGEAILTDAGEPTDESNDEE